MGVEAGGYDLTEMALTVGTFGAYAAAKEAGAFGDPRKGMFSSGDDDDDQQQQAAPTATQEKATPKAAKVDGAKSILSKQSNQRKRYLLQQSTGQAPQAPSLSQQSPTRNLLGG